MASAINSLYVPDDCWIHILRLVTDDGDDRDYHHSLKHLSSASKEFFSVTNRLRFALTIYTSTRPYLPRILERFPNLTCLNFSHLSHYNYNSADIPRFLSEFSALLLEISLFPLKLTSLNLSNKPMIPANGLPAVSQNITTLTSLTCSNIRYINSTDMFLIADCFPLLEELDLSNDGTFTHIFSRVVMLSVALFKLCKVNLSGCYYVNDKWLSHLFKNCKVLEEAIVFKCYQLTKAGIASALLERPTLRSFSFTSYSKEQEYAMLFAFINNCPSLNEINVKYQCRKVQNVENPNPLMNFVVSPQLKSHSLVSNSRLTDENMEMFTSSFPDLQWLDLSRCRMSEKGISHVLRMCCKMRHVDVWSSLAGIGKITI